MISEVGQSRSWPEAPGAGPLGDDRWAVALHQPRDVSALCDLVRTEAGAGGAVYPQGGRTAIDYGSPPARPGAAVDLTALKQVVDYPHADMTITVQAGISIAALKAVLAEQNQRLLFDVPRPDAATIGGALATGVSGPRRFGLGRSRDSVIGISFVTAEGVEVKGGGRVVKNVAGYDFPKLLTGSMGSLGIITQATLKVRPLPAASALIRVVADGLERFDAWLSAANASSIRPVAIELLNPSAAENIGGPAAWTLLVGIEDGEQSVEWQIGRFQREFGVGDVQVVRDDATEPIWRALTEFQVGTPGPFTCSASMRPSALAGFLNGLSPDRWAVQVHAGNGVVRLQALGDWTEDDAVVVVGSKRTEAVRDGGNLIVSRCPTAWKPRLRVWGAARGDWILGRAVKRALDPHDVMNPGRFVGEE